MKGVDPKLVTALKERVDRAKSKKALTVDDVIAMWSEKKPEADVIALIRACPKPIELTVDDALRLGAAGVPTTVLRAIRESRGARIAEAATPKRRLTREDVLKLTTEGATPEAIVAKIRDGDSKFELTPEDILVLDKQGVHRDVLREMYRRSEALAPAESSDTKTVAARGEPTSQPSSSGPDNGEAPLAPKFDLFHETGAGFSMLMPRGFRTVKDFKGRKTLVQILPAESKGDRDLPDYEMSVLIARPKDDDATALVPGNLKNVANQFLAGFKERFEKDHIKVASKEPIAAHISGVDALFATSTAAAPDGTGHVGGNYVLFAGGAVVVVSYSCRIETAGVWRAALDMCARSISVSGPAQPLELKDADPAKAAQKVFAAWRRSFETNDYATWCLCLSKHSPDAADRLRFAEDRDFWTTGEKRIEYDGYDAALRHVRFNVFTNEGKARHILPLIGSSEEPKIAAEARPEAAVR